MKTDAGDGLGRRDALAALAVAGFAVAAGSPAAGTAAANDSAANSLLAAFTAAWATAAGATSIPVSRRLEFLADDAIIVDDDTPFPLSKAEYADHAGFHAGNWERVEWLTYNAAVARHGDSGIVSANYIVRGKPKGAGFRLRAGYCTAVCVHDAGGWRAISVHMAPLIGQLTDASPG